MTCYKIYSIRATVPENQKVAPEEKWVHGGSIEVPYIYNIDAPNMYLKKNVCEIIKDCEC